MPLFLDQQQLYRLIQRELPDGAYPDGTPDAFYSTADSWATAGRFAELYANLSSEVYDNYFPQYATSRLADFETLYLGKPLGSGLTIAERRARVVAKVRSQRRTTPADIKATVYSVVDTSVPVEIWEICCGNTGWVLDESRLDFTTILNEFNGLEHVGPDLCRLGPADYGMTAQQFADLQAMAYEYQVRIYGYTLTENERIALDDALNQAEPARSKHVIVDGLDPADMLDESC